MMKKIIIIILLIFIIIGSILFINEKNNKKIEEQNNKRYEEIKKDIETELKRYLYVIAPKCQPNNGTPLITHLSLIYALQYDFLSISKNFSLFIPAL